MLLLLSTDQAWDALHCGLNIEIILLQQSNYIPLAKNAIDCNLIVVAFIFALPCNQIRPKSATDPVETNMERIDVGVSP